MKGRYTCLFPHSKCKYEVKLVGNAKGVVEISFVIQKSLTYLDLSLCEYSNFKRNMKKRFSTTEENVILTEENFRKRFALDRKLLYDFHLDVPKELEYSLRYDQRKRRSFYAQTILLNEIVFTPKDYDVFINLLISRALEKTNLKLRILYQVIKLGKEMKFLLPNEHVSDRGLDALYFQKADSNIVKDFLIAMNFSVDTLLYTFYDVFEFVLHSCNRTRYNLLSRPLDKDFINASISSNMLVKTVLLLQFRDAPRFCSILYENLQRLGRFPIITYANENPVQSGLITRERHFLLLQICHIFRKHPFNAMETLQIVWRSLPDSYITLDELNSIFGERNSELIKKLCNFIKDITGEDVKEKFQPRKLKHECRIVMRRVLSNNYQLSTGMTELNLPLLLRSYLRLEC